MKIILEHKNIDNDCSLIKTAEACLGELGIRFDKLSIDDQDKRFWIFDMKSGEESYVNFYIITDNNNGMSDKLINSNDLNRLIVENILSQTEKKVNDYEAPEYKDYDEDESLKGEQSSIRPEDLKKYDPGDQDDNDDDYVLSEDDMKSIEQAEIINNELTKEDLKEEFIERLKLIKSLKESSSPLEALNALVEYFDDDTIFEVTERFFIDENDTE